MSITDLLGLRAARNPTRATPARPPRWVVAVSIGLPVVLLIGWLAADAVQPAGYSPVRQTVSVTAGYAGSHRWIMTTALFLIGMSYLVLAASLHVVGLPARLGLALAGASGLGIAANPVTRHETAMQHDIWTVVGALTITLWPLLVARRRASARAWTQRLDVALAVTAAFVVLTGWLVAQTRSGSVLGLAERVSSTLQAGWPAVVAVSLRAAATRAVRASADQRDAAVLATDRDGR